MEWNEDDVEVMNTNTLIKELSRSMKTLSNVQFILIAIGFIIYLADVSLPL